MTVALPSPGDVRSILAHAPPNHIGSDMSLEPTCRKLKAVHVLSESHNQQSHQPEHLHGKPLLSLPAERQSLKKQRDTTHVVQTGKRVRGPRLERHNMPKRHVSEALVFDNLNPFWVNYNISPA